MYLQCMPKTEFPAALKKIIETLNIDNLKSGFHACDLVSLNREEVLKRLPDQDSTEDRQNQFDAVIVDPLKELSGSVADKTRPPRH